MISVITASLPSRGRMLAECMASVSAQTRQPLEHLVGVDYMRRGSSATRNGLLYGASGDWIAVVDDDDLLLPRHLELLRETGADIVYSFCAVDGRPGWTPNREFDAEALRTGNFIPATTLIRRDLLLDLDGWRDSAECPHGWEDWDLWLRCLDAEASFACVPEVTWRYRFHGGNKTIRGEREAA